jgi:CBS domain containing-hemolysin-like protein
VSVDRALVEKRAEEGDRRSSEILDTLRNLTLSLSGIQLAITAISLVVGYLAQPTIGAAIAPLFSLAGLSPGTARAVATGIALALATAAQMVVGEFVPQNAGIARPAEASRRVIVPLRLYTALF